MGEPILGRLNATKVRYGIFCVGLIVSIVVVTGGIPMAGAILGIIDREETSVQIDFQGMETDGELPQVRVFKRRPYWDLSVNDDNEADLQWFPGHLTSRRVEISRADTDVSWHIQLRHKPLRVEGNARYSLRFRARADDARSMGVAVSQAHSPWEDLGPYRTVAVTKQWQEYDWDFVATDDEDNAQLHFNLGGWNVPVELDGVRLLKLSHGTPPWTLNLVGGSEAGIVGITEESEGLRVAITTVDRKIPYHIQLIQSGISMQAQVRYRVRFEARADATREIAVAVGQAHDPWEELGLYQWVSLSPDWQTFEFDVIAQRTDDEARLYFDLGGASIPVELKAVQFSPQPNMLIQRQVPSHPALPSVFDTMPPPSG